MCELTFYNKKTGKKIIEKNLTYDIKVSFSKTADRGMYISFFNFSFVKIGSKKGRIEVASSGSRLYFRANEEDGYKIQTSSNGKHKEGSGFLSLPLSLTELSEWAEKYPGKYSLLFDESMNLYCIDANGAASKT